ncbi:HdeD family acid-resistance protein [Pantoea phytobeneficialis]|uniref:Protease n=1 Tax=Pantoea phytobeneficialis TaxID=2052056 RepID=A0AAP9H6V5_9GAMM|nr:hypothetical protein [Pantoea phytobeneficialis]MDO6405126.1 hypothetical protein [Pantoea phytobeneficialis]QGR07654.1 hypothetical protein CTZ24_15005 [Pantoea phytobeneficialis]
MIKLIFLLTGAQVIRRRWYWLALVGSALLILSALILYDISSDGLLSVPLDLLAIFFIIEGLVQMTFAFIREMRIDGLTLLKALGLWFIGFLILNIPQDNNDVSAVLFGIAFMVDGLFRIAAAVVLRGWRWRKQCLTGVVEWFISILILSDWPFHHHIAVPLCFALLLLSIGTTLLQMARQANLLTDNSTVTTLPLFKVGGLRQWHSSQYVHPPFPHRPPTQPLKVYVWTPLGSGRLRESYQLINRYIAAVDQHGVISTGHAAMEAGEDLYISHYPLDDIDRDSSNFRAVLRSGEHNDVAGRFLASLTLEVADWCAPDKQILFTHYNFKALHNFWHSYRLDSTYNLTARNCSSAVIQALDVAIEGVLARKPYAGLRLFSDPNFWLLGVVRGRAEEMTWTPGLVLDYVRLLHRVIEPQPSSLWPVRLWRSLCLRHALWQQKRTPSRSVIK